MWAHLNIIAVVILIVGPLQTRYLQGIGPQSPRPSSKLQTTQLRAAVI